jgi:hypothetical protein
MLVVTTDRIVVAVAMGNAIVMVIAKVSPVSTGIRHSGLHQGECENESWEDYFTHRGLDEVALEVTRTSFSDVVRDVAIPTMSNLSVMNLTGKGLISRDVFKR